MALCLDLGCSGTPTARLRTRASILKLFRCAGDHRDALDTYEEELEEYTKALKERAAKSEEDKDEKKDKKKEEMKADEVRKHNHAERARGERVDGGDTDWGEGWKMAAESVMRGVARAKDLLAKLEAD